MERENNELVPKPESITTFSRPPSPEEVARRQRVFAETFAFRSRLTLMDFPMAELLYEDED